MVLLEEVRGDVKFLIDYYQQLDQKIDRVARESLERDEALDRKIDLYSSTLVGDMTTLRGDTSVLKGDVSTLKGDVSILKGAVSTLKEDVLTLKGDVSTLKEDVSTLKGDVSTLKGDMSTLTQKMDQGFAAVMHEIRALTERFDAHDRAHA